uniref:Uncharacterized protein n=1 Tax=Burkholderia phage vB_BgluM-SURPRISE13 TaxID=3159457 RepID=A0AAU7PG37_9VIRU
MEKNLIRPRNGEIYTLADINSKLYLRDSPCLLFRHEGKDVPIQDSHLEETMDKLVDGLGETQWTYIRETEEWIPVFRAVDDAEVLKFVDIEREIDPFQKEPEKLGWHATPKGFPQQQYYADPENIPDWMKQ